MLDIKGLAPPYALSQVRVRLNLEPPDGKGVPTGPGLVNTQPIESPAVESDNDDATYPSDADATSNGPNAGADDVPPLGLHARNFDIALAYCVCVHTSNSNSTTPNFNAAYRTNARAPNERCGARSCDAKALNVAVGPARYNGG